MVVLYPWSPPHLLVLRDAGHHVEREVGHPLDEVLVRGERGRVHHKVFLGTLEQLEQLLNVGLVLLGLKEF